MQQTAPWSATPAARISVRPQHIGVGPVEVFDGDIDQATDLILRAIDEGRGARVATANLDFVARARRDAQLRHDLATSDLVTADGAPVAWLARVAGAERITRVTGVDLVAALCARAASRPAGLRIAMYGSTPEVAGAAARELEARYPGVAVVAQICPPFRDLSDDELALHLAELSAVDPDVVLVALGCPRQERFIARHQHVAPRAAWLGIGGTFDFYAGTRRRAPGLLQRVGGEWLARLVQEPRRLWRRYFLDDIPALFAVAPACLEARLRSPRAGDTASGE
ncbi:MAG: WecB/TagA/CpsF family glycosyltransferase [Hyphomicrobiales bacterium]